MEVPLTHSGFYSQPTLSPSLPLCCIFFQAQFSHTGSSFHLRTPYPYRIPEGAWWPVVLSNVVYAVGPHLLAYRCLYSPGFFCPVIQRQQDEGKKNQ